MNAVCPNCYFDGDHSTDYIDGKHILKCPRCRHFFDMPSVETEQLSDEQIAMANLLRENLLGSNNKGLDRFLTGYAQGRVAGMLIDMMVPEARKAFFAQMKKEYPDAFEPEN